ncbi:MAG: DNA-processing protein DprA [Candidatus Omnitrophota bacterium]|nr:DNA-processing protein DprA [Candidatus Omnitrophota bacterium]
MNLVPGIGSTPLRRVLDACGSLERLWTASVQELQQAGASGQMAQRLVGSRDERLLAKEQALAQGHGVTMVTLEDVDYPKPLREIADPPLALYIRGSLPAEELAVAIVGSRHASLYGIETAQRLGYELALRGIAVVSGLARGIDGASHRGALEALGRTVAVLGSGLANLYPPEHRELADQIAGQGAVISEYPMETMPEPYNFPRRNRIISGLSLGVVVVEAAARSGALITAGCALEQGREVFAVPGPITTPTSQGTHHLLKDGAKLVTSVDDILEELRLTPETLPLARDVAPGEAQPLAEEERRVFACVSQDEPRYIDTIAADSGMEMSAVSSLLSQLELRHAVRQLPGKRFIRSR